MNEEDIKILEDYIELIKKGYCEDCNELCNIYGTPTYPAKKISEAIENLINRNKKLKEENKILKNVVSEIFNSEDVTDKYILISLVEEKIEELDRKIKYEDNEKVIIWLHKQRKILQELLEKRE